MRFRQRRERSGARDPFSDINWLCPSWRSSKESNSVNSSDDSCKQAIQKHGILNRSNKVRLYPRSTLIQITHFSFTQCSLVVGNRPSKAKHMTETETKFYLQQNKEKI